MVIFTPWQKHHVEEEDSKTGRRVDLTLVAVVATRHQNVVIRQLRRSEPSNAHSRRAQDERIKKILGVWCGVPTVSRLAHVTITMMIFKSSRFSCVPRNL